MRLDDVSGDSSRIEDRRGRGGSGGSGFGGGGLPIGKGGGLIGIVVVLVLAFLGKGMVGGDGGDGGGGTGVDMGDILGQMGGGPANVAQAPTEATGGDPDAQYEFIDKLGAVLDDYWEHELSASGQRFEQPGLVIFDAPTTTGGCGVGQPEFGPFYCPGDSKIYLDFTFYEKLEDQLGFSGDFAMAYVVAHEYGHVLQLRAWDGDYGYDGVGVSWSASRPAEHRIAFKEGWANFLARVVLDDMPCDAPAWDDNATKELPGDLGDGASWVTNVNKLLCDWYDTRNDDDPTLAGGGDHFAADSFYSMWQNLRNMYLSRDAYGGDYHDGLWICDWVAYYLDVRKSSAAVGQAAHDGYVASITDLIYNNNIACGLASP